ncbi:hypothetical protein LTR36_001795 [Oleoguttula mirabilis]|uniref:Uncharacterized protein n=1 Tax=Oleoguttula mirabilis TaxID=1507867 RepID=A0AAV9JNH8_9PEZI|nr:hypothetical protein LTR36_001795 [Oleoguttula mirabilis]
MDETACGEVSECVREAAYREEEAYWAELARWEEAAYWDEVAGWEEAAYLARLAVEAWRSENANMHSAAQAQISNELSVHGSLATAEPHTPGCGSEDVHDANNTLSEALAYASLDALEEACHPRDEYPSVVGHGGETHRSGRDGLNSHQAALGPLPPGAMDAGTKRQIQEAIRRTPQYLFRSCTNDPAYPSGGHTDLNTPSAITPMAFSRGGRGGSPSVYELSPMVLGGMALSHLCDARVETQFSSWAASLQTTL